jgi:hypothetical protein
MASHHSEGIPHVSRQDQSIVLDVRAELHDGQQVDLEMQSTAPAGTRVRFLYYWAKIFSESIGRGKDYAKLDPGRSFPPRSSFTPSNSPSSAWHPRRRRLSSSGGLGFYGPRPPNSWKPSLAKTRS